MSSSSLKSYKHPNYEKWQMAAKKNSMFSEVKDPQMVAGSAYLGYKLGKGTSKLSMFRFKVYAYYMQHTVFVVLSNSLIYFF